MVKKIQMYYQFKLSNCLVLEVTATSTNFFNKNQAESPEKQ